MEKKKYIVLAIIGSLLFSVLILYNFNIIQIPQQTNEEKNEEDTSETYEQPENMNLSGIALIVDYNNGSEKIVDEIQIVAENNTVFDVLLAHCEIEYTEYPNGEVFIEAIDGIKNKHPNYWLYYVNGESAQVGASSYQIEGEDEITWIYGSENEDDSIDGNNTKDEISIPSFSINIIIFMLSFDIFIRVYYYRKRDRDTESNEKF
ncbi:MAG: DUF4430 domain-containing protein [Promethearchaeia archaeon]